ncbi:MAG: LysR family transcriptional regulator [Minwuiales bacterium]|nr:LysR family transcriptional regulator [Minwuiales bacterium]
MNWDDLRYFLAVASGGSLSAAARQMGVSQATVWRHVDSLEAALGTRLFDHRRTGYSPSPAGETLLEKARQIEADMAALRKAVTGSAGPLAGEVRLTGPEFLATGLLTEALAGFCAEHPALRTELITGSPAAMLSRRETDIALLFDLPLRGDFAVEKRSAVGFGVYASHAYVERHGRPAAVGEFTDHLLIDFDDSAGHVAPARWLKSGGRGARTVFRSNSADARLTAAKAGHGIAMLPALIGDAEPGLKCLFGPDALGRLELTLLVGERVRRTPRVKAVCDFVADTLAEHAAAISG